MSKILISLLFIYLSTAVNGKGRIAGGDAVDITAFPFAVSMVTNGGQGSYQHACGGSIITATAILSAASCYHTEGELDPAAWWRVRTASTFSNTGGLIQLIRLITPHPSFSPASLDNDVAVLRTTLAISLVPGLVETAFITAGGTTLSTNQPVEAIGWGATSEQDSSASVQLRHVQFWVVDQTTCTNRYANNGFTVTSNMVCTGWLDVGIRGQCLGDTGSPLLSSSGAIVGVFSYSEGCPNSFLPGINTRISPYTRWIVNTATA